MCLRYSFAMKTEADMIDRAVAAVLDQGIRTGDIMQPGKRQVGTKAMGAAVLEALDTHQR